MPAPDGGSLLEAEVSPADLAAARARWRDGTRAAVLGVLALTLLLCSGPLIDCAASDAIPRGFVIADRRC